MLVPFSPYNFLLPLTEPVVPEGEELPDLPSRLALFEKIHLFLYAEVAKMDLDLTLLRNQ